jgi:hypothetical protein
MASMFMNTQLSSAHKRHSQAFKDSGHIYFIYKLLNVMPHFPSNIGCNGAELGFKICAEKILRGLKTGEHAGRGNWSFTSLNTPASRIIFGQPLMRFMTVMAWSTIMLIPHVKIHIE